MLSHSLKTLSWLVVLASCCSSVALADHRSHSHSGFRFSGSHFSGGFGGHYGYGSSSRHYYGGGFYPGYSYGYPYSFGLGSGLSVRLYSGPSYYSSYSSPYYVSGYYAPSYVGSSPYVTTYAPSQNYVMAPTTIERSIVVERESMRPAEPTDGGPIVITNPNPEPVSYSINGHRFTMKPGQSQKFSNDRRWIVEFDQELGRGRTKYTLNSGSFKFKHTSAGWDFVQCVERAQSDVAPPAPTDTPAEAPAPLIVPSPM